MEMHGTSCALTWGNEIRTALIPLFHLHNRPWSTYVLPVPPPAWCRRGCTVPGEGWSPAETEHSGEAPRRRRSPLWCRVRSASPLAAARIGTRITRGDRRQSRDVAWRCCARVVLQRCPSLTSGELRNRAPGSTTPSTVGPPTPPTTTSTTAPVTSATTGPVLPPAPQQTVARVIAIPVTTTTVTPKVAPVSAPPVETASSERGQATWYAAAPPGRCASPTLPFGTVLTVTNVDTGASTTCVVDDREQAGYPRVVDMSPSGFAQLASPSQGVVNVTISW